MRLPAGRVSIAAVKHSTLEHRARWGRAKARLASGRVCRVAALAALLAGCDWTGSPEGTSVDAGGAPPGLAHDRIFVSQAGSATIVAIDGDSGAIEGRVEVG